MVVMQPEPKSRKVGACLSASVIVSTGFGLFSEKNVSMWITSVNKTEGSQCHRPPGQLLTHAGQPKVRLCFPSASAF